MTPAVFAVCAREVTILSRSSMGNPSSRMNPADAYSIVRNELMQYNPKLAEKKEIVIANKTDLLDTESGNKFIQTLEEKISKPVCAVSMVTGKNIGTLLNMMVSALNEIQSPKSELLCC